MPYKPKKPCAYPGCPKLTDGRCCEEHQRLRDQDYEKYQRNPAHKDRYHSRSWRAIRKMQLSRQPLCEICMKDGRYTAASLVHHIRPLEEGGTNDPDNLMSLCAACHSRLHSERGDRWGKHPGSTEVPYAD